MKIFSSVPIAALALLSKSETVSAGGWKRGWDDDWGGSSKSSKTAEPTFYPTNSPTFSPTLSPTTSGKSGKSWGGWDDDDDDDDWGGWKKKKRGTTKRRKGKFGHVLHIFLVTAVNSNDDVIQGITIVGAETLRRQRFSRTKLRLLRRRSKLPRTASRRSPLTKIQGKSNLKVYVAFLANKVCQ